MACTCSSSSHLLFPFLLPQIRIMLARPKKKEAERKEGNGTMKEGGAEKTETKATHPASNVKRAVPIAVATTGPSNTADADSGGGAKEGDGGGGGSGGGT
jgi:hypothetical protein